MLNPISRQEESTFPTFTSHEDAAAFFKKRYGADFIFQDSEPIGEQLCYFYAIVINQKDYNDGRQLLSKGKPISGELGLKFLLSYQPVQIMEDGSVHIVH